MLIKGIILLSFATAFGYDVKLRKKSTIYLPYSYNQDGSGNFDLDKGSAEQMTYDSDNKIVYVVGNDLLYVVSVSDPANMQILTYKAFPGVEFTDVELCGGYVFATVDNATAKTEGQVLVFSTYNAPSKSISLLFQFTVGFRPDMLKPTKDCSKLAVSVEGATYDNDDGGITDPPGLVVIASFPNGINTDFTLKTLNFDDFNGKVSSLRSSGVRHVYQENNNTFSNDVEPEYITFNDDNTIAYVALQENNAIAVVDMKTENITHIYGLGFKDWSKSTLDASDKDTGALMYPYAIWGMYQPDAIKHFRFRGESFILTANEGSVKDLNGWSEEVRGKDINKNILPGLDDTTRDQLGEDSLLGRLKFSVSPAGMNSSGHLEALYTFGSRGFSIWRADDMSLVYDSGDDIAKKTLLLRKELFNTNIDKPKNRVFEDRDGRSDDKGAEPESLAVGEVEGRTLLFIGNEKPGTIFVYSLDKDVSKPVFHDIYDGIPDKRGKSWQKLFDAREISELDPEDIHFVPADRSPTGGPVLFSTGTDSGTLSIIEVNVTPTSQPTSPPPTMATCNGGSVINLKGASLLLVLMTVISLHI